MVRINTRTHWPPRVGDNVCRLDRELEGKRRDGKIVMIDREMQEVIVEFAGRKVVFVLECYQLNGQTVRSTHYRIDGIMYPTIIDVMCPDLLNTDGTTDSFSFDDLEGNWSTLEQAWWLA